MRGREPRAGGRADGGLSSKVPPEPRHPGKSPAAPIALLDFANALSPGTGRSEKGRRNRAPSRVLAPGPIGCRILVGLSGDRLWGHSPEGREEAAPTA